jgi:hypothetical protein
MIDQFVKSLIENLIDSVGAERVKVAVDKALDKIEDAVSKSPNKLDDAIVLPLIKKLVREPFGIADNDVVVDEQPEVVDITETSTPTE